LTDSEIESKWQKRWEEEGVYQVNLPTRPKVYVTAAYPYPNGLLHLGHLGTYLPADFTARYHRMKGRDVLFPMAFHVTGPATTGFARAIQRGDRDVIEDYHNVHRVSYEDIQSFKNPERIVDYFSRKIRSNFRDLGLAIDWRRSFMTKDPPYTRFIEWQFSKLDAGGHLVKGSHPVIWCDSCGNAVGEADRLEGESVDVVEFFVIKFTLDDGRILPAATLRPETVFGVTNMWLKPGGDYRLVRVGDERWIVGAEAIEKLARQKDKPEEIGEVDPEDLFGAYCTNPVRGDSVPILPASFVDTANATGVVMSVPAHAPIDYQALEDLKADPRKLPESVDASAVEEIEPIALITVEGLGEFPAVDIVKEMGIESQDEVEGLEKATQAIYKKEFYEGILGERTGKYAGRTVSEAKDVLSKDLRDEGIVDLLYETSGPVICRCRTPCHVRLVSDQWFIDYGNPAWKETTMALLAGMRVVPEKLRSSFQYYIDWMREKPCARKIGFGTPFPRDPKWIVEPLSDSTIYMAYYTVARIINAEKIDPKALTPQVFNFILLGEGEAEEVSRSSGIRVNLLEAMRHEFLSWYPNDIRFVGPDLVGNHATFFMYNHAAIFPEELWPKGIAVSGIVLNEGQKMSKSKGNSIPITDSLDEWGADIVRLWFAACAEFGQDINYEATLRNSVAKRLTWFGEQIAGIGSQGTFREGKDRLIDRWLSSRIDGRISTVEKHIQNVSPRKAIQELMFETYNDLQYYARRTGGDKNHGLLADVLEKWVKMMAPFAPHFCEEMWEKLGREPFLVNQTWPTPSGQPSPDAEIAERLVANTLDDVKRILAATSSSYSKLNIYIAEQWKRELFVLSARKVLQGCKMPEAIAEAMRDPEIRKMGKPAASFIQRIYADFTRRPKDELEELISAEVDEAAVLAEASEFIAAEMGMEILLQSAERPVRDPEGKASRALPFKPAIFME
jgi:leucyl-tRNA synthetase